MNEFKKSREYWLHKLSGDLCEVKILTDFPRSRYYEGETYNIDFNREIVDFMNRTSKGNDISLFVFLLTVVKIVAYKYSEHGDIIVSSPCLKGKNIEYNKIVLLRDLLSPSISFRELLLQVKDTVVDAYKNQHFPISKILESINPGSKVFLFKIFALLENIHDESGKSELLENYRNEIIFSFFKTEEKLGCHLYYNSKIYKQETISQIIHHYNCVLNQIVANPAVNLQNIDLISMEEKKRLLEEFNRTGTGYPKEKTLHELYEEQVIKVPDHTAVIFENVHITYSHLNYLSNQLGDLLFQKGVTDDHLVSLMAKRSIEMIIGILGILKPGGAYLPIDPANPVERSRYILRDSRSKILLTTTHFSRECQLLEKEEDQSHLDVIYLDSIEFKPLSAYVSSKRFASNPNNLAYVIYTSGSTGRPKGVMIEHRNVVNYISWAIKHYIGVQNINFPLFTSPAFDLTVTSIFCPLLSGNAIVVYEDENPEMLIERIIEENRVDVVKLTPSHLKLILSSRYFDSTLSFSRKPKSNIKCFIVGGELFEAGLAREIFQKFNNRLTIHNEYGPTEATVGCMIYSFSEVETYHSVPIGSPSANNRIYLLDKNKIPVPPGVPGEIFIAGAGLARGYLNKPELMSEKFIHSPGFNEIFKSVSSPLEREKHYPGGILYKTGDLGRWLPGEKIEYLGRMDHQVKIRGFRVELGEIEHELLRHKKIKDALVIANEKVKDSIYLCAYYLSDTILTPTELKEYLSQYLPVSMIPLYFIRLEKFPLTSHGKIDRNALPNPEDVKSDDDTEYIYPRNEIEKKLWEIWKNVLGRQKIGVTHNFFTIGGDSIKSIQISARLRKEGYRVGMRDIFQNPTIAELARFVKKEERKSDQSAMIGIVPLTPIQKAFFQNQKVDRHHFNHAVMLYSKEGFDEAAVNVIFKKIQEHHDALRMTYKEEKGEIIQYNHGLDYPLSLQTFDLRNQKNAKEELELAAQRMQTEIDLEKGPLMKLGLFLLEDGDRLLIIVHHLVIDGVSWRIMFEDIETLYQQYKRSENLELPWKTDSFKLWSEKLSEYSNSEEFLKELNWWKRWETVKFDDIQKDFPDGSNFMKDVAKLSFTLSEEETEFLLTKVHESFKTEINDILLTALGLAINKTWNLHNVLIGFESHGRQEIIKNLDIHRTIGWFSCFYPILLFISNVKSLSRVIKEIKENLRSIPNQGIGYSILKYLTPLESKNSVDFNLSPQFLFNYLGQFDGDLEEKSFKQSRESVGNVLSPNIQRDFEIDIASIIANKRMFISISYSKNQYRKESMERFLKQYEAELRQVIQYCFNKKEREISPSDLTFKELSIDDLENLESIFIARGLGKIKDLYPLSPMQEGMFFHSLYNKNSSEYFEQVSYRFKGNMNRVYVERGLDELLKRYDILRTVFIHDILDRPVQVVLSERKVDFYFEEIPYDSDRDKIDSYIKKFKEKDRNRSFVLDKDVLIRISLLQINAAEYEFIFSHHHLLMDGWCTDILISEFMEIYNSLTVGNIYYLPKVVQYRTYIQWLEQQDKESPKKYWRKYLDQFETATGITKKNISISEKSYKLEKLSFHLEGEKSKRLNQFAQRNRVTLNTVIQAIWGIILARYNNKQDVVFGAVVSGRPPDIVGVETMVGLFINTIPVRIRYDAETTFKKLVHEIQESAVESEPYHYFRLADIQSLSSLKNNLLDHIVAFQNIQLKKQTENTAKSPEYFNNQALSLRVLTTEAFEHSNYDLNVVINPSDSLGISFHFNSNIYEKEVLEKVFYHFSQVVEQVLSNDDIYIFQINFLSEKDKLDLIKRIRNEKMKSPIIENDIHVSEKKKIEANFNF